MNDIPFNIALIDHNGCKCVVRFRKQRPFYGSPLVGEIKKDGLWMSATWDDNDDNIIGTWSYREPTRDEKIELFAKWLDGAKIEYVQRHYDTDKWSDTINPLWNWENFIFRVKGEADD